MVFELPRGAKPREVTVSASGQRVGATTRLDENVLTLTLEEPVLVRANQNLEVEIKLTRR